MDTQIFLPMYYMVWLTTAVFLFSLTIRLKEVYLNKGEAAVDGEEHRHPPFTTGSMLLKNAQRNLSNLLEFPILFYAVCICIYITQNTDDVFIDLAYWFFYLRVLHSLYHVFFNQLIWKGIPLRAFIWAPATTILVVMWIRFASLI